MAVFSALFLLTCGIHLENDLENLMQESELLDEDPELLDRNDSDLDFGDEDFEAQGSKEGDWRDNSVRRVWGVNDVTAVSGQYFEYRIPKDAFTKGVQHYSVSITINHRSSCPPFDFPNFYEKK